MYIYIYQYRIYIYTYPNKCLIALEPVFLVLATALQNLPQGDIANRCRRTFESLAWTVWEDARLASVVRYVRGSQALVIPEEWRQALAKDDP